MFIIDKIKILKLRKKWRKLNKHNFTAIVNRFNFDLVSVGKNTYGAINAYIFNDEQKLKIGNYCSIGPNVAFMLSVDHDTNFVSTYPFKAKFFGGVDATSKGDIIVDDDVWIGYGATILSGVHIAQGAVIAAGSVVTKDVPPYAIVGGVPAKVIKYRFDESLIQKLLTLDYSKLTAEIVKENQELFYEPLSNENVNKFIELFGKN